jgi:hypothetical protein
MAKKYFALRNENTGVVIDVVWADQVQVNRMIAESVTPLAVAFSSVDYSTVKDMVQTL